MSGFDSICIRFKNIKEWQSPLANTRTVPFVNSYFEVIKSCINDINTEYFWVFPSFMHCKEIEFDFIPEQFEKDQIHVWYTTHPLGGLNKEGHVLLIPTKQFKKQMKDLKFLRDFKDINYHEHSTLDTLFSIRHKKSFAAPLFSPLAEIATEVALSAGLDSGAAKRFCAPWITQRRMTYFLVRA